MKNHLLKLLAFNLILGLLTLSSCSKPGCTDSEATNYDEKANEDDNSCEYSMTYYATNNVWDFVSASSGDLLTDVFIQPLFEGMQINLNADGTMTARIPNEESGEMETITGTWAFQNNETEVVLESDGESQVIKIKSLSATQAVLIFVTDDGFGNELEIEITME